MHWSWFVQCGLWCASRFQLNGCGDWGFGVWQLIVPGQILRFWEGDEDLWEIQIVVVVHRPQSVASSSPGWRLTKMV
jgi:hypothetical protein